MAPMEVLIGSVPVGSTRDIDRSPYPYALSWPAFHLFKARAVLTCPGICAAEAIELEHLS